MVYLGYFICLHTKVCIKHSVEMKAVKAMQELHTSSLENTCSDTPTQTVCALACHVAVCTNLVCTTVIGCRVAEDQMS